MSSKDSVFARYTGDLAVLTEPFCGSFNLWPCAERDHNQFATIEEKHIFSTSVINTAHFGYSRPLETLNSITPDAPFNFYGGALIDGTISASTVTLGGAYASDPIRLMQNKFATGDDVLWTKGAHTLRMGASITRVQDGTLQGSVGGGAWTFNSPTLFCKATQRSSRARYRGTSPCTMPMAPYPPLACLAIAANAIFANSGMRLTFRMTGRFGRL